MSDMLAGSSGNDEIQTPRDLFNKLDATYQFDYDAFASDLNALCELYSTLSGTGFIYKLVDQRDGLAYPWRNHRVFLNPPYSKLMAVAEKMVSERNNAEIIVALIKVDTSTRWWQTLAPYAHIDYLPRRVKYVHPDPPKGWAGASFPSAIVLMKKDWM